MAKGFSLLELIVVLAVLGLMMAVGAATVGRGGEAARTRLAAHDLAAALTATRSSAIAHARSERLHLDLDARTYNGPGDIRGRLPDRGAVTLTTAERERTGARAGAIRFFPDGSATGGRIAIGERAWARVVTVDWMTGRVRTETPEDSADAPP